MPAAVCVRQWVQSVPELAGRSGGLVRVVRVMSGGPCLRTFGGDHLRPRDLVGDSVPAETDAGQAQRQAGSLAAVDDALQRFFFGGVLGVREEALQVVQAADAFGGAAPRLPSGDFEAQDLYLLLEQLQCLRGRGEVVGALCGLRPADLRLGGITLRGIAGGGVAGGRVAGEGGAELGGESLHAVATENQGVAQRFALLIPVLNTGAPQIVADLRLAGRDPARAVTNWLRRTGPLRSPSLLMGSSTAIGRFFGGGFPRRAEERPYRR